MKNGRLASNCPLGYMVVPGYRPGALRLDPGRQRAASMPGRPLRVLDWVSPLAESQGILFATLCKPLHLADARRIDNRLDKAMSRLSGQSANG
jgi:hypothetical protein